MEDKKPGFLLEKLCRKARRELVIAAPFIKVNALQRLLASVDTNLPVRCVTRWRIEELMSGVSDLAVWNVLSVRNNSSLWLRSDLHAKYYRGDEKCLIGSANITNAALGWSKLSNFELLISIKHEHQELADFEKNLFVACVRVDESLYNHVVKTVDRISNQPVTNAPIIHEEPLTLPNSVELNRNLIPPESWLPTLRSPDILYKAYRGETAKFTMAQKEAALIDLASLPVPLGLSTDAFVASIAILLLQKPIIQAVDRFIVTSQRFGAVRDLLASLPCANYPNFDASDAWQTLMRWMLYFLPYRYKLKVPSYSEVIFKIE